MLAFIQANLATILISAVVAVLFILAVLRVVKKTSKGDCGCSGCSACPYEGGCTPYKLEPTDGTLKNK